MRSGVVFFLLFSVVFSCFFFLLYFGGGGFLFLCGGTVRRFDMPRVLDSPSLPCVPTFAVLDSAFNKSVSPPSQARPPRRARADIRTRARLGSFRQRSPASRKEKKKEKHPRSGSTDGGRRFCSRMHRRLPPAVSLSLGFVAFRRLRCRARTCWIARTPARRAPYHTLPKLPKMQRLRFLGLVFARSTEPPVFRRQAILGTPDRSKGVASKGVCTRRAHRIAAIPNCGPRGGQQSLPHRPPPTGRRWRALGLSPRDDGAAQAMARCCTLLPTATALAMTTPRATWAGCALQERSGATRQRQRAAPRSPPRRAQLYCAVAHRTAPHWLAGTYISGNVLYLAAGGVSQALRHVIALIGLTCADPPISPSSIATGQPALLAVRLLGSTARWPTAGVATYMRRLPGRSPVRPGVRGAGHDAPPPPDSLPPPTAAPVTRGVACSQMPLLPAPVAIGKRSARSDPVRGSHWPRRYAMPVASGRAPPPPTPPPPTPPRSRTDAESDLRGWRFRTCTLASHAVAVLLARLWRCTPPGRRSRLEQSVSSMECLCARPPRRAGWTGRFCSVRHACGVPGAAEPTPVPVRPLLSARSLLLPCPPECLCAPPRVRMMTNLLRLTTNDAGSATHLSD